MLNQLLSSLWEHKCANFELQQVKQCFGGKYFVDYIESEVEVLEQQDQPNTPKWYVSYVNHVVILRITKNLEGNLSSSRRLRIKGKALLCPKRKGWREKNGKNVYNTG